MIASRPLTRLIESAGQIAPETTEETPDAPGVLTQTQTALVEVAGSNGSRWEAVLIEAGDSLNGRHYPASALASAVPLFEGARVYDSHGDPRQNPADRPAAQLVGWISDAHQVGPQVRGVLNVFRARQGIIEMLREKPDIMGLSINAAGPTKPGLVNGVRKVLVEAIQKVYSVDLVAHPACGGRLVRLLTESADGRMVEVQDDLPPITTAAAATQENSMTEEQIRALIAEVLAAHATALRESAEATATAQPAADARLTALTEQVTALTTSLQEASNVRIVESALGAVRVSDTIAARVRSHFAGRLIESADVVTAFIRSEQDYAATLAPARRSVIRIEAGEDESEKKAKAIADLFIPGSNLRGGYRSLQESYADYYGITVSEINSRRLMSEMNGDSADRFDNAGNLRESVSTTTWGSVFFDSMYKAFLDQFNAPINLQHRTVVRVRGVNNFDPHYTITLGGYPNLSAVGERGQYVNIASPTDQKTPIVVTKFGNLEDISWEALLRDSLGVVSTLPLRLQNAASRTEMEAVTNYLSNGFTTSLFVPDTLPIFDASRGNLTTTALSIAAVSAARAAMRRQKATGSTTQTVGIQNVAKYLVVPPELELLANQIVTGAVVLGTQADVNVVRNLGLQVLVLDTLTDVNDWFLIADPNLATAIELALLNGHENPELFTQDDPRQGTPFNKDVVTYKIRHVFGTAVADPRPLYGAKVAG